MIPSPSHPWSPWRPVAAIGWLAFVVLLAGSVATFGAAVSYGHRQADACRLRWHTAKTPAGSIRVASDCGVSK